MDFQSERSLASRAVAELRLVRSMKATLLLLAITIGAHVYAHDLPSAVFSDRRTYDRFVAATDVTATRLLLKKSPNGTIAGDPWKLISYTRGETTIIPQAEAQQLRTLFTSQSSFLWHSDPENGPRQIKACAPDYGVLFSFRGSDGLVSIALCFRCDLFGVFWGEDDKAFRVNAEEDFDRIRPQLVELVKRLFPQDAIIQGLKPVNPNDGT